MLSEYNFLINQRNKAMSSIKDGPLKENEEWITITDFETGQPKRVKKIKSI